MTLRRQTVDFIRLDLLNDANEVGRVREVAVVKCQPHVDLVWILIEMIYPLGIEQRGAALDPVNNVAFAEQKFREVSSVLPRDPGNQGSLRHRTPLVHQYRQFSI